LAADGRLSTTFADAEPDNPLVFEAQVIPKVRVTEGLAGTKGSVTV
jgi:hypothetical protein